MDPLVVDLRQRRAQGYESARPDVQALVPTNAKRILEFGCSTGALGAALKSRQASRVTGIEVDPVLAVEARERLDEVIVEDLDAVVAGNSLTGRDFDCLIAADVLEHLVDPWTVLRAARRLLAPQARVIVSVPNILYYKALRRVVVDATWPLDDQGVFDRTHLRWFTVQDAAKMVEDAGFVDVSIHPQIWEESGYRGIRKGLLAVAKRSPAKDFLPAQTIITAVNPAGGTFK